MEPLVEGGEMVGYTTWTSIYARGVWNGHNVVHIDDGGHHSGLYYYLCAEVEMESSLVGIEMDFFFWSFLEVKVKPSGFRDIKKKY